MKNIFFVFLFSISFLTYSQESKDVLTDSSMVLGILTEYASIGEGIDNYCFIENKKNIPDERVVLIRGVKNCKRYSDSYETFIEIILNDKEYLVKPNEIEVFKNDFINKYASFSDAQKEKFSSLATLTGAALHKSKLEEIIKFTDSCIPKGLCVLKWNIYDESEHTEGTSLKISLLNPTKKVIKYLWFTIVGYNPVGDKVFERTKQSTSITLKAVGPINASESGEYNFEYVWFTDLVETAKIIQIKVQYMDGSTKIISNVNSITMDKEMLKVLEIE